MKNRSLASVMAALLPILLGLGLIDLYVSRDLPIGVVAAGMLALAAVMIVAAALGDIAAANPPRRRRARIE